MTKIPTESQEQRAVVDFLNLIKCPHFHIPNGGARNKITAARLKAEGVSAGVPDLCIPVPSSGFHGLFIEMKRKKGGSLSDAQKKWLRILDINGYQASVCKGAEDAIQTIERYLKG